MQNLRFPGQYYDEETGLHYNWHRYYKPDWGRYVGVDPVEKTILLFLRITSEEEEIFSEIKRDFHPYIYVGNSPLKWIDPYGLWRYVERYGTTGAGLTENMRKIENIVDRVFMEYANREAIVTYTTNGVHGINSLHYSGNAIDLRINDIPDQKRWHDIANALRRQLGMDYDVVLEIKGIESHIHIEYQPKKAKGCKRK